jgi:hypothetical protein
MIISKSDSPLDAFTCHGIKTISGASYLLLVDETGNTLIQYVSSDNTTILFNLMPHVPDSTVTSSIGIVQNLPPTMAQISTAITNYWAGTIQNYSYTYLFLL